uniref:Uncharacterized protein n=1 Tax=Crocodylus porosus TaxID=8502 RepID=A0A7M4E6N7_CROPO
MGHLRNSPISSPFLLSFILGKHRESERPRWAKGDRTFQVPCGEKHLPPHVHSPVFSSVWLLSTVSVGGSAVALAVASSAAVGVTAVVTAAGTSACLGSSLSWASSAFKDGELSVEALVALSVSVAAGVGFSSEEAAGVVAFGAGCSELASVAPSPFFSSTGALPSLLPSSGWALSEGAASVAEGASLSLFSATPSVGASSFLSAVSASAAWASPFFSPLSFFLVMCPRKLAWILVAAL